MDKLVYFYNQGHQKHFEPGHPERPERVEAIRSALHENGYWESYSKLPPISLPQGVITNVHSQEFLSILEETCRKGMHFDADTYTTAASWDLAHKSAGGAAAIATAVWSGEAKRGFALTRPPGHHATRQRAMGFCLLNNVALAAEYLFHHAGANRLAIIDLDLHHGNGTQDIFYSRGEVLYISTHQYPHYPGTGWIDETGSGAGRMTNANMPLPALSGDSTFIRVMDEFIMPLLNRFMPEMILVSYGFDSHYNDPLGSLELSSKGYGELISRLTSWADKFCQGRIALFLEGGYDLQAAKVCSVAVVKALIGEDLSQVEAQERQKMPGEKSQAFEGILEQAKILWELT